MFLAACGGASNDTTQPTPTSDSASTSPEAADSTSPEAIDPSPTATSENSSTEALSDMSLSGLIAMGFAEMGDTERAEFCEGLDFLGTDFVLEMLRAEEGGEQLLENADPDEVAAAFEQQCGDARDTEGGDEDDEDTAQGNDEPVGLGETQTIGDYEVTLTEFQADATDTVMDMNQFNEPPENGAYATAAFEVSYVGDEEGDPGFDLSYVVVADGRQVSDSDGTCSTNESIYDMGTLENGGSGSFVGCYDINPDAVDRIFVEELLSMDDTRVTWTP